MAKVLTLLTYGVITKDGIYAGFSTMKKQPQKQFIIQGSPLVLPFASGTEGQGDAIAIFDVTDYVPSIRDESKEGV